MTQPSGNDPEDLPRLLAYRRAYGMAADLVEQAGIEWSGHGAADLPEREARRLAGRIGEEVQREMGPDADQGAVAEVIGDAIAGRRPSW